MGIILTILKIIGILLLILLSLILFLILVVLFVPFCYWMRAESIPKGVRAEGWVSWLFGAIKVSLGFTLTKQGGRDVTRDICIFGISLYKARAWLRGRKKRKAEARLKKRREERVRRLEKMKRTDPEAYERERQMALSRRKARHEAMRAAERAAEAANENAVKTAYAAGEPGETAETVAEAAGDKAAGEAGVIADTAPEAAGDKAAGEAGEPEGSEKISSEEIAAELVLPKETADAGEAQEAKKRSLSERVSAFLDNLLDRLTGLLIRILVFLCNLPSRIAITLVRLVGRVLRAVGKVRKAADFLLDYRTKSFIRRVFYTLRKVLGHAFPKRISGHLRFGLPDPSWTGIATGMFGWIYPKFRGRFRLEPVFDETTFDGNIAFKGRVYLFYPVFLGLRLLFDKNTKFIIRTVRKGSKRTVSFQKRSRK